MSEWPKQMAFEVLGGRGDSEREMRAVNPATGISVIPADLGRELYEELKMTRQAYMGQSGIEQQPSDALTRYEREVGK